MEARHRDGRSCRRSFRSRSSSRLRDEQLRPSSLGLATATRMAARFSGRPDPRLRSRVLLAHSSDLHQPGHRILGFSPIGHPDPRAHPPDLVAGNDTEPEACLRRGSVWLQVPGADRDVDCPGRCPRPREGATHRMACPCDAVLQSDTRRTHHQRSVMGSLCRGRPSSCVHRDCPRSQHSGCSEPSGSLVLGRFFRRRSNDLAAVATLVTSLDSTCPTLVVATDSPVHRIRDGGGPARQHDQISCTR